MGLQGTVQGAMMGLRALGESFAPLLFGLLISVMADLPGHQAGLAYTLDTVLIVPALIAVARLHPSPAVTVLVGEGPGNHPCSPKLCLDDV